MVLEIVVFSLAICLPFASILIENVLLTKKSIKSKIDPDYRWVDFSGNTQNYKYVVQWNTNRDIVRRTKIVFSGIELKQTTHIFAQPNQAEVAIDFPIQKSQGMEEKDVKKLLDRHVGGLEKKLNEIEAAYPSDDQIEKYAAINDAILNAKLSLTEKNLKESLEKMASSIPTKWDIAKIVMLIIGAFAGIAGIVSGVVTFIVFLLKK